MSRTRHSRRLGRTRLTLATHTGQLGDGPAATCACWRLTDFGSGRRHQGRLGFTYGIRKRHRVQACPLFARWSFHLVTGCVVLDQSVTGCGGLTATLDRDGAVPNVVDQLGSGLKEIHVHKRCPVKMRQGMSGDLARVVQRQLLLPAHCDSFGPNGNNW